MSESDTVGTSTDASVEFGANEWLVDELWSLYQKDPQLVEKSWWPLFESRAAQSGVSVPQAPATAPAEDVAPITAPIAKTTSIAPKEQPIPAEAPTLTTTSIPIVDPSEEAEASDTVAPLKGMAKAWAANMDQSLQAPTATSVRTVPAKLMIDNRIVINNHLRRTRGGKVSFT
ncbi:MAG: 2-oxo acid dehydrogenase subunit E2, partial [Pontimonas sp.]|nr:2-oxo acid dehydrogenase subunit E2 [Pontimonas sp.]